MSFLKKVPFLPVSDTLYQEETARLADELKKEEDAS